MTVLGRALAVLVAILAWPTGAAAHVESTGYSEIRGDGAQVRYELGVDYDALAESAGLDPEALAATTERRAQILDEERTALGFYLFHRLEVSAGEARCAGRIERTALEQRQGIDLAVIGLVYDCPTADGAFGVRYEVFPSTEGFVGRHTNIADYELGGTSGRFVFDEDRPLLLPRDESLVSFAGHFVATGTEHILLGWDHVLFLLVLLLGARSLREVVRLATAFTVAHSVTLALASLGWVDIPAAIVEPLIALSIALVAVETVLGGDSRLRLPVVFAFGLLHGLGFAGTISFSDDGIRLLGSILSFNAGIELGQALIVTLLFPLLLLLRRHAWSRVAHVGAASAAAAVGLFWFVDRMPI